MSAPETKCSLKLGRKDSCRPIKPRGKGPFSVMLATPTAVKVAQILKYIQPEIVR